MTKSKNLDQLRAEKERAETQLAQEQHKLERLENRLSQGQIGVISAPICAFYHCSLGGGPLFPPSPARSNSILGQNWVRNRGIPIFLAWRPRFFLRDGMAHGIIKVQSQEKL